MKNDKSFYNDKTSSYEELLSKHGSVSIHHKKNCKKLLQKIKKLPRLMSQNYE